MQLSLCKIFVPIINKNLNFSKYILSILGFDVWKKSSHDHDWKGQNWEARRTVEEWMTHCHVQIIWYNFVSDI